MVHHDQLSSDELLQKTIVDNDHIKHDDGVRLCFTRASIIEEQRK